MEPTQAKPVKKRRRWLIVALFSCWSVALLGGIGHVGTRVCGEVVGHRQQATFWPTFADCRQSIR